MKTEVVDGKVLAIPQDVEAMLVCFFDLRDPGGSGTCRRLFKTYPGLLDQLQSEISRITKPDDYPEAMNYLKVTDQATGQTAIFIPDRPEVHVTGEVLRDLKYKIFLALGAALNLKQKVIVMLPTETRRAELFLDYVRMNQSPDNFNATIIIATYDLADINRLIDDSEYHLLD